MDRLPGPLLLDGGDAINRGLVGFWPLTEGAGSLARDISPYRRNGTLTSFSFTAGSGWRAGSFGKTLVFDGTDDLVESAAYSTTSNQPVSVFAWVNPSAFTNFAGVTTNLIEGTFLGWVLYLHGDQTVGTYLDAHRRSTNTIPANVWSHIGFAYNGSTVELYINGMLQRSDAGATYTGNTKFRIGNFYTTVNVGASRFAGAANSVRVFNRRVPASEVQRLYRDPWAGTVRTRRRVLATSGTQYSLTTDPLSYEYTVGDAGLGWGRTLDTGPLSHEHALGDVDFIVRRTLDAEAVAYEYSVPSVALDYTPAQTGDTHDGFVRRSRRERALAAAERRRRDDLAQEAVALRLSLEAAMGMAAEVAEDATAEAAEAVQAATKRAARLVPTLAEARADEAVLVTARETVAALRAAVDEAARARALAEDDEEVLLLLRAL